MKNPLQLTSMILITVLFIPLLLACSGSDSSAQNKENTTTTEVAQNAVLTSNPGEEAEEIVAETEEVADVNSKRPETNSEEASKLNSTKKAGKTAEKPLPAPEYVVEKKKEVAEKVKESAPTSTTVKETIEEVKKKPAEVIKEVEAVKEEVSKVEPTKPTPPTETIKTETETVKAPVVKKPLGVDHAVFDGLLRKFVSGAGKVNYKGLKQNVATLDGYLDLLAKNAPASSWSRKETMAYWINAYNAFTLKLIIKNYPVSSITKLHGGKPWDVKWIKLGSKTYSLNNIENDILRPKYKDARIHFAVNCAAKSCPPLLNRAWTAANLNSNFDKQAKAFINNTSFNTVQKGSIEISKIFEWYAVDFDKNIVDYINKYANTKADSGAKVKYKEYNWALNE